MKFGLFLIDFKNEAAPSCNLQFSNENSLYYLEFTWHSIPTIFSSLWWWQIEKIEYICRSLTHVCSKQVFTSSWLFLKTNASTLSRISTSFFFTYDRPCNKFINWTTIYLRWNDGTELFSIWNLCKWFSLFWIPAASKLYSLKMLCLFYLGAFERLCFVLYLVLTTESYWH